MPRSAFALAFALTAAGCGPLIQGEVDDARICKTVTDTLPGAPAGPASTQDWSADYALGKALPQKPKDAVVTLDFVSVTLTLTAGATSFGFVDSAQVGASTSGQPSQTLVVYVRSPTEAVGTTLELAPTTPVNVLSLVQSGNVHLDGKVSGKLPQQTWTMDVRTCFVATYAFHGL